MDTSPIHGAFATPIYRRLWPRSDDLNEGLRQLILEREPADAKAYRSNVGGWHSANDLLTWQAPEIPQLVQRIQQALQDAAAARNGGRPLPQSDVSVFAWANVLHAGGYNRVHDHDRFTWSGVYYVDAGEGVLGDGMSGHLEFVDPRNGVGEDFAQVLRLRPEAGAMVLFPGWLKHFVHPYRGGRPRVSVAFNVSIDPRDRAEPQR